VCKYRPNHLHRITQANRIPFYGAKTIADFLDLHMANEAQCPMKQSVLNEILKAELDQDAPVRYQMLATNGGCDGYHVSSYLLGMNPWSVDNPHMRTIIAWIKSAFKSCENCGEMKVEEHFPKDYLCCRDVSTWCSLCTGQNLEKQYKSKKRSLELITCPHCFASLTELMQQCFCGWLKGCKLTTCPKCNGTN
jgi:hypothetical protein